MDYLRKLKLILSIECKLSELDTSYTYQDAEFNHYEYNDNILNDICQELNVEYNKYSYKTIRQLEKELIDNLIE